MNKQLSVDDAVLFLRKDPAHAQEMVDSYLGGDVLASARLFAASGEFQQVLRELGGSVQGLGLEWLFRLAKEPGRLWKRYLLTNVAFLFLAPVEWLGLWSKERA